jgi:ubiquinone/menaquinone biosynthesis C-methylase UbiE
MNIFDWIERELHPMTCSSAEFMYDEMDSQSGYCLPIIYQPFDAANRAHWRDRGSCFDFLYATQGEDKNLLDFGPGDGWPSLVIAPFVQNVVGVDASQRRVDVCHENAKRLGIQNTTFIHVEPGKPLPFEEETFDGVVAASSIEQTPDPFHALQELHRVLKKGGHMRIDYEDLNQYRGGKEQEVYFDGINDQESSLTLYDRVIDQEKTHMYKIYFSMTGAALKKHFSGKDSTPGITDVTIDKLRAIIGIASRVCQCSLTHPSARTLISLLRKIGFYKILPSHSGAWFAGQLYDVLPPTVRPKDMQTVDDLIRPLIRIVVSMPAVVSQDPMITAVKR